MNKSRLSVLAAGLLALAGVQAQTASPSDPVAQAYPSPSYPAASTVQVVPGATVMPRTGEEIRAETRGMGVAAATTSIPDRAGEASTMVRGVPNMYPDRAAYATQYSRRAGVPATLPVDSPSVFEGGTPQ